MGLFIEITISLALLAYTAGATLYFLGLGPGRAKISNLAFIITIIGWAGSLSAVILRSIITHRPALNSGHEFLLVFVTITVGLYLIFEVKSGLKTAGGPVILIAALLLLSVVIMDPGRLREISPLMPALKSPWLTVHVLTAAAAYGCFALAAGLAVIRICTQHAVQDEGIYTFVAAGFAMLSLSIILGAIWAEQAWGTYWSWDPKEIWALVTWIIYALYLHLHRNQNWRGETASILVIMGFILVLFTFFGVNYLFSGLHSYT